MTRDEKQALLADHPAIGCAALLAMFSLLLAVPFALFGWLFGNETALRLGVGFFLWPILTLLGFRLATWVMKVVVKVLGI
jgi:hypothetical protein